MGQEVRFADQHKVNGDALETLLDSAIVDVRWQPLSATNPFGRCKEACLNIHATVYPWYLRHFCVKTYRYARGNSSHRQGIGLHSKYARETGECKGHVAGLDLYGASASIHFDADVRDEGLELTPFRQCDSPGQRCATAPVILLHAMHRGGVGKDFDVFLILTQIPAVADKADCYKRIGMLRLDCDAPGVESWEKIVHNRVTAIRKEFWLF